MSSATSTSPDTDRLLSGRYRVKERIARGGMATVHRGVDERLDRVVALKIMHPHLALNEQFRRRFAREARSAARLAHRNVVGVFDQGEDGDTIYLAMELVGGETLREHMSRPNALSIDDTLDITAQILEALAAAHAAGIVHRDIKPENVLIDERGTVKVADFGLARAIGTSHSTTSTTLLGTVAYISPEVVTRGHCDERSDLYSLGVMMHEMLTGAQPFVGEQAVHVAFQHVHEDIPAPSASAEGIPRALDSLVTWAASRRPESRPADARELLRAVRELRASLPPSVLRSYPQPKEASDTADVPEITAAIDSEVLEGLRERRPFLPAAQWAPASSLTAGGLEGSDAHDHDPTGKSGDRKSEDGTLVGADDGAQDAQPLAPRAVVMRSPRPRRGRHLPVGTKRRSRGAAFLAALVLVGSVALGAWAGTDWYLTTGPGANRTVPVLAGTELEQAESALTAQDLEPRTTEEFSETVPAGHVISASPESGETVKSGSTVHLVISRGRETFTVPNLSGLPLQEARGKVEELSLVLVEDPAQYSETVPEGAVISQSQQAEALPRGGEVHVVVSRGREPITVPNQTGRTAEAAKKALGDAGFTVTTSTAHSGSVPKGSVISQEPAGGTLFRGDSVRLVISAGPEMITVPNVFRKDEAQAKAILERAGFRVVVKHDRGTPVFGLVYEQSAAAGSKIAKGSTITITVF